MRKIEKQIKAAFEARQSLSIDNTMTDGNAVFLHGNKIIERRKDGVYCTLAGWPTVTTRSRLNSIANANFSQCKHEQYCGPQKILDHSAWFKVS